MYKITRQMARNHVKDRSRQRYNEALNREDLRIITGQLRNPEKNKSRLVFLERQPRSENAFVWAVFYKGRWFVVLYDFTKREIVSVLPRYLIVKHADKIFTPEHRQPRTVSGYHLVTSFVSKAPLPKETVFGEKLSLPKGIMHKFFPDKKL